MSMTEMRADLGICRIHALSESCLCDKDKPIYLLLWGLFGKVTDIRRNAFFVIFRSVFFLRILIETQMSTLTPKCLCKVFH